MTSDEKTTAHPKAQSGGEDTVFKPMTEIFKNIIAMVIENSDLKLTADHCTLELEQNPSMTPTSADSYLVAKDRFNMNGKIPSWADITLSCEYKWKDGSDELDDARRAEVSMDALNSIKVKKHGKEMGDPIVLKDIWIDHDHMREGTILAQLYEDVDKEDKKLVKKHFLTTVCHGDVLIEPSVVDDTWDLMQGLKTTPDITSGLQSLHAMSQLHVPHPNLTYSHKTHYHIVFKEKGDTIDLLKKPCDVMKVLGDIVAALKLLKKLKWVHWDVSIGNILYHERGGKLADLEYAKRIGDMMSHEMRTACRTLLGTIHFMSIEVSTQEFLFPPDEPSGSGDFGELLTREIEGSMTESPHSGVQFIHMPLHDLESLCCLDSFPPYHGEHMSPLWVPANIYEELLTSKHVTCSHLNVLQCNLIQGHKKVQEKLPHSIDLNAVDDDVYNNFSYIWNYEVETIKGRIS
ncbi:hypothetical protein BS47DRAFT_1366317 [Hydnum rufescens UP504]|uniref:Fungal-type protein kinase domain-containing protein n=1 Tax=Hydnum rufescens UP504 TaxID=1448309 RepID=A0A9P6AL89_9AGAM|nr:hypothetical protein BS47DRAFT_1366317 [Hydnum rufescens UP504]